MKLLLKDSSLAGLKGSIQYCDDCQKPTAHYSTPNGWPICHACGYNADLMRLCAEEQAVDFSKPPVHLPKVAHHS